MARSFLFLPALFLAVGVSAQDTLAGPNLVPNGSFEQVTKEPTTFDQLTSAEGWSNVTIGFSEVFSKSAPAKTVGLPDNEYGHMEPQEGAHYAGFFAWKDDHRGGIVGDDPFEPGWNTYSEYPTIELEEALFEGRTYMLRFYVALAGTSDRAISGIGAYCSPIPLQYNNRKFIQEHPQVASDVILEERGKWVEITDTFVADGGESYLILGTFPMASFDTKRIVEGLDNQYAYYYIDHVELREVPAVE